MIPPRIKENPTYACLMFTWVTILLDNYCLLGYSSIIRMNDHTRGTLNPFIQVYIHIHYLLIIEVNHLFFFSSLYIKFSKLY